MNAIKCCISCILPCGAFDVIRIVHANGRVDEINGSVKAEEIMKLHPKHVLKKPSSPSEQGMCPTIVIVPPEAELKRGKIYFLMPQPPPPSPEKARPRSSARRKKQGSSEAQKNRFASRSGPNRINYVSAENLLISDRYLSEILSEKISTQRDRRPGRVRVWRPHLESISETPVEA
ncbi:hypothetical protein OROGR_012667 [Orobanche gracilis]